MKKKTFFSLILVTLFFLIPQFVGFINSSQSAMAASNSLATIENINGGVFIKKAGGIKEIKGMNGMDITQGDSVRTDKEGSANIFFRSGSKMTVGPKTSLIVDRLEETKASGLKVSIRLKGGTLWNSVKSLQNEEDKYEIVTASSTVNVKGTLHFVEDDSITGESTTSVFEGAVDTTSANPVFEDQATVLKNMGIWQGSSNTSPAQPSVPVPAATARQAEAMLGNSPPRQSQVNPPLSAPTLSNGSQPLLAPPAAPPSAPVAPPPPAAPPSAPVAPPPPAAPPAATGPIDLNMLQNQHPSVLANMAVDMATRGQELQDQADALIRSYESTNDLTYLYYGFQQYQGGLELSNLFQNFLGVVQNSSDEQQVNQYLEQLNSDMDEMDRTSSQIAERANEQRDRLGNNASQAGLDLEEAQRQAQRYPSRTVPSTIPSDDRGEGPVLPDATSIDQDNSSNGPINPVKIDPIKDAYSKDVSNTSATLAWSIAQDPNYLLLQTSYDGQNWTSYSGNHTIASDGRAIIVNDLSPNTKYYFRILTTKVSNNSFSNIIHITTKQTQLNEMSDITGIARVGEILRAGKVTPENATVTYQWQIAASIDGTFEDIEGQTDNQYIIEADAVGRFIRVVATGLGDYSGTVLSNPTQAVAEPIPINWLLPEPTVSINTDEETPQVIIEYAANQSGTAYYIITDEGSVFEDDKELIYLMTLGWEENDSIIYRGSEKFTSEESQRLAIPYSGGIFANKNYKLYMVLEGVDTYTEVKGFTFSTPKDVKPPALTASFVFNEESSEFNISHLVNDYDELYDLYVWIIPKDSKPIDEPTAQEVKDAAQDKFLDQACGCEGEAIISAVSFIPATEYIIYVVAQDKSNVGEYEEGLYSEVKQFTVTMPSSGP